MKAIAAAVAASAAFFCASASADPLPKSATPMTSEAIRLMYSGNTAVWADSDIYFAPDGSIKGILGKPAAKNIIEGTWAIEGNTFCLYTFRSKAQVSSCDCYLWWRDGKRAISLWSPRSDGAPVDAANGYRLGEERNLKVGDLVSARYSAAPGL
jgi:hypothetical protein